MMKVFPVLVLFCSLIVCAAEDDPKLFIVGYVEFPPYSYTNDKGQADGTLIILAKEILALSGYSYQIISFPAKRLIKYLSTGDVDAWIGLNTEKDLSDIAYIGEEIIEIITLNIYSVSDKKIIGVMDLKNKKVIVLRGYSYGGIIDFIKEPDHHIKTIITNTHQSAFQMLLSKRADYLLAYQQPADFSLNKMPIENLNLATISQLPLYFIVSKKSPNAENTLKRLEEILRKIKQKN